MAKTVGFRTKAPSQQPNNGGSGAGGAIAAGGALAFMSGSNPATCTDDSFGCKLSHATNNLSMMVRILLIVLLLGALFYGVWFFFMTKKNGRK